MLRARGAIIPEKPARKQRIVPPAHLLGQEHTAGPQHAKQLVGAVCAMAAKRNIKRIVCKRQRFLCGVAFLHMDAERCKLVAVAFHIRPPGFRDGRVFIRVAQRKQKRAARVHLKQLIRIMKPPLHLCIKIPGQRFLLPAAVQVGEIPAAERERFFKTPKIIEFVAGHIFPPISRSRSATTSVPTGRLSPALQGRAQGGGAPRCAQAARRSQSPRRV